MSDVTIEAETTAVLFTDPQKELLTPDSVVWDEIGETVEENAVVEKLVRLRDAVENGYEVLVVSDATGALSEDMLGAARINFEMIAHETASTDDVATRLSTA